MYRLADEGHTVVGIECAKQACEEFFKESQLECITETVGKFTVLKVHTHRNLREPVVTTKLYNVSSLYLMQSNRML